MANRNRLTVPKAGRKLKTRRSRAMSLDDLHRSEWGAGRAGEAGRDPTEKNGPHVVGGTAIVQSGFAKEIEEVGTTFLATSLDNPPDRGDRSRSVVFMQDLPFHHGGGWRAGLCGCFSHADIIRDGGGGGKAARPVFGLAPCGMMAAA